MYKTNSPIKKLGSRITFPAEWSEHPDFQTGDAQIPSLFVVNVHVSGDYVFLWLYCYSTGGLLTSVHPLRFVVVFFQGSRAAAIDGRIFSSW